MPYTTPGKNFALDALAAEITHVGLLQATAIAAVTGTAASDLLTKVGHGLVNGDVVIATLLAGGEGVGLFNNVPYYVVGVAGNDFQLSPVAGGAAVNFTTDIVDCTITKYTELAGGSYARQAIAWAAAADGSVDDTTNGIDFDVAAGTTVAAAGYYDAAAAGNLLLLDPVTPETFTGDGVYTLSDADFDLNLDRVPA